MRLQKGRRWEREREGEADRPTAPRHSTAALPVVSAARFYSAAGAGAGG